MTRPITTPCCNAHLIVTTRPEGRAYLEYDVPDEIFCAAHGCHNSWNADGTLPDWLTGKDQQ